MKWLGIMLLTGTITILVIVIPLAIQNARGDHISWKVIDKNYTPSWIGYQTVGDITYPVTHPATYKVKWRALHTEGFYEYWVLVDSFEYHSTNIGDTGPERSE